MKTVEDVNQIEVLQSRYKTTNKFSLSQARVALEILAKDKLGKSGAIKSLHEFFALDKNATPSIFKELVIVGQTTGGQEVSIKPIAKAQMYFYQKNGNNYTKVNPTTDDTSKFYSASPLDFDSKNLSTDALKLIQVFKNWQATATLRIKYVPINDLPVKRSNLPNDDIVIKNIERDESSLNKSFVSDTSVLYNQVNKSYRSGDILDGIWGELAEERQGLNNQISGLEDEKKVLIAQRQEALQKYEQAEKLIKELEQKSTQDKNTLIVQKTQIETKAKTDLQTINNKLTQITNENQGLKNTVSSNNQTINTLQNDKNNLVGQVSSLSNQLASANSNYQYYANLYNQNAHKINGYDQLQSQVSSLQNQLLQAQKAPAGSAIETQIQGGAQITFQNFSGIIRAQGIFYTQIGDNCSYKA